MQRQVDLEKAGLTFFVIWRRYSTTRYFDRLAPFHVD